MCRLTKWRWGGVGQGVQKQSTVNREQATINGRATAVLLAHERHEALLDELARLRALQLGEGGVASEVKGGLAGLATLAEDLGVDDLAEQHDHYLYGTPRR